MHAIWQQFLQDHTIDSLTPPDTPAFIELSDLGLIQIQGPDAEKFLQGQLTCDCRQLPHLDACYGAHCNPKGRILANFIIFYWKNNYYLSLPRTMCEILLTSLKKFALFSKVELTDCSDTFLQFGLLEETISEKEKNNSYRIHLPDNTHRHLIITPANQLTTWRKHFHHLPLISHNSWHTLDIQANIASITPKTSEAFTPQAIDFDKIKQAVDFKKGCYIGQEIIARMHYLGKSKDGLAKASISLKSKPILNSAITDENQKTIGYLVNVALTNTDNYRLLLSLRKTSIGTTKLFYNNHDITLTSTI